MINVDAPKFKIGLVHSLRQKNLLCLSGIRYILNSNLREK